MNKIQKDQKWYIYGKKADFNQLAKDHGITPVTARIMINRGVRPEDFDDFLYGATYHTHDSHSLMDMDLAVDIIEDAIATGQKIRVVGDYDIDGVCATTILIKAFKRLGGHVDHDIPERIRDGYGINERIIDKALQDGVNIIVTCDNGIAALDAINKAVKNSIAVVITDHHEPPEELPDADAIVDPKQSGDEYPFKEICGAFLAYKLVEILYNHAGISEDELRELIVFASIATVGDVMPLIDENRKLVKRGLAILRGEDNVHTTMNNNYSSNTRSVFNNLDSNTGSITGGTSKTEAFKLNKGLSALIDACQVRREKISAYTIGFVLGPCINAGGRLGSAQLAMELFATEDECHTLGLAEQLKNLNDERKSMTERFVDVARLQVENDYADDSMLVIYLPDCHESVAGIIAGRIKEYYHRPTIVFTDTGNGEDLVKGSARSIESYDVHAKLTEVADLLEKFGGHKLAAGMSLKREKLDELRRRLNENAGLTPEDLIEKIWIDVALPFGYATVEQTAQLELLEPFGQGNDRPVFAQKNVAVLSAKSLPGHNNFVKLRLKDEGGCICDGIIFADADETLNALAKKDRIDILYYPKPDNYGGRQSVQIQVKAFK